MLLPCDHWSVEILGKTVYIGIPYFGFDVFLLCFLLLLLEEIYSGKVRCHPFVLLMESVIKEWVHSVGCGIVKVIVNDIF